jgi:hypothetical protein
MVDRKTGKSFTPLVPALSIPSHDHYLEEALEPAIGLVVHVSYRRATSEMGRIQNRFMSHTTVHRRLQEFAQDHFWITPPSHFAPQKVSGLVVGFSWLQKEITMQKILLGKSIVKAKIGTI